MDFAAIWTERFMAYYALLMPRSSDKACYGVSFATGRDDIIDYVAGMAVDDVPDLPEGLVVREVLAARYAVFRCTVNTIGKTYERIFKEWLPTAQCQHDPSAPAFEFYPPGTVKAATPPCRSTFR